MCRFGNTEFVSSFFEKKNQKNYYQKSTKQIHGCHIPAGYGETIFSNLKMLLFELIGIIMVYVKIIQLAHLNINYEFDE